VSRSLSRIREVAGVVRTRVECCIFVDRRLDEQQRALDDAIGTLARELSRLPTQGSYTGNAEVRWVPPHHEVDRLRQHPMWSRYASHVASSQLRIEYSSDRDALATPLRGSDEYFAPMAMARVVAELMLVADLAYPGLLYLRRPLLFLDGTPCDTDVPLPGLRLRLERPLLAPASPTAVYRWIRSVPGYNEGLGLGPAGRALSALAHVQRDELDESYFERLVWAVLGIEALVGSDTASVSESVRQALRPLVGPHKGIEAMLGSMYRLRSDLLHARRDLPMPQSLSIYPTDTLGQARVRRVADGFHTDVEEASDIAILTLVVLLRLRLHQEYGA
jgi:hypothetical protein